MKKTPSAFCYYLTAKNEIYDLSRNLLALNRNQPPTNLQKFFAANHHSSNTALDILKAFMPEVGRLECDPLHLSEAMNENEDFMVYGLISPYFLSMLKSLGQSEPYLGFREWLNKESISYPFFKEKIHINLAKKKFSLGEGSHLQKKSVLEFLKKMGEEKPLFLFTFHNQATHSKRLTVESYQDLNQLTPSVKTVFSSKNLFYSFQQSFLFSKQHNLSLDKIQFNQKKVIQFGCSFLLQVLFFLSEPEGDAQLIDLETNQLVRIACL